MNVLILNGSPRTSGNSAVITRMLSDSLTASRSQVTEMRLHNMEIKPCSDCRYCKTGSMECIIRDDMVRIYSALENHSAVIFVTPIYWYGPPAQLKLAIDRLRPYFLSRKLRGKKGAVITVAGEGFRDSTLVFSMFRKIFKTLEIIDKGVSSLKAYDAGDVLSNKSLQRTVSTTCRNILAGSLGS